MEVEKTLRPGSDGTKRFVERFGERLICVRHRHDRQRGMRYTTVEIVVETRPTHWSARANPNPPIAQPVAVRIGYRERELRQRASALGGRWDPRRRVWLLPPDAVTKLELQDRVV